MDKENLLKAIKDKKDSTIVEHQWTTDGVENFSYADESNFFGITDSNIKKEKMTEKGFRVCGLMTGKNLY